MESQNRWDSKEDIRSTKRLWAKRKHEGQWFKKATVICKKVCWSKKNRLIRKKALIKKEDFWFKKISTKKEEVDLSRTLLRKEEYFDSKRIWVKKKVAWIMERSIDEQKKMIQ